jgi:threonine efflux protein
MEYLILLLSLAAVDMLSAMSPGPNFLLVSDTADRASRAAAAAVVAGFTATNVIWCAAALLGLAVLFQAAPWLYGAVKVLGGGYLLYLGIRLWRGTPAGSAVPAAALRRRAAFLRGALTNLANPKSAIYFGSIFALFLAPGTPAWVQVTAVGIVLANTVLWYGAVAMLFSDARVRGRFLRMRRGFDRVAGTAMGGFGAHLIGRGVAASWARITP